MPLAEERTGGVAVFGNTAVASGEGRWSWQAFVRLPPEATGLVKGIELHLHPTFSPSVVPMVQDGDEFRSTTFSGWGTFKLRAVVTFDSARVLSRPCSITHDMSFDRELSETPQTLAFQLRPAHKDTQESESRCRTATVMLPEDRDEVLAALKGRGATSPGDKDFWHGRCCSGWDLPAPKVTWGSKQKPRDDHDAPEWLTASEFGDQEAALSAKCEALATLLRMSKRTVLYTGAGISAGAGIGQAARGAGAGGGRSTDAVPTFTHFAMGALSKAGLLHGWVQQNHDGLPQKAGFPQQSINEIHGSWYDPANPVVKYSGTLHERAYPWMRKEAQEADLVLVLGTSLGGLNADQMAHKPAGRSMQGRSLGNVIINLQQTESDGKSSLRLFAKSDDVMRRVLQALKIPLPDCRPRAYPSTPRVLVPYDSEGRLSKTERTWLDLRDGQRIRLTDGHNIQGAQQPHFMHIGADAPVLIGGRRVEPAPGNGVVERLDNVQSGFVLRIEGVRMLLGVWWLETALQGAVEQLPIVNVSPERA